ncbi:site-2 protease family protein [Nakamurella sp. A5-74]|uniref:Site-2 protease family protein n=1 Tax=Nakamurella sp. A5-74 TaxID=3158264 RepID=A0AAU8DLE3_9ACTN
MGSVSRRASDLWVFPVIVLVTAAAAAFCAGASTGAAAGPWIFVTVFGGWVITLCLHEFAHAVVSLAGGDTSVRERGYLWLNPVRYSDATTSLVIPLVLLAVGGIPLPGGAVVVEPYRLRRRWWASLVSAAGPVTNLLLGIALVLVAVRLDSFLGTALAFLGLLQFVAGVLNLLPVPGFDGFGILTPYLSGAFLQKIRPLQPWLPLAVFAILFSVPGAGSALFDIGRWLTDAFGGSSFQANIGGSLFRFWQ